MSVASTDPGTPGAFERSETSRRRGAPSDRLWWSLSRSSERAMPLTGADRFGAAAARRIVGRAPSRGALRRSAERVLAMRSSFENASEGVIREEADSAREAAITGRLHGEALERAMAVGAEAVRKVTGLTLHPEQVMGALGLVKGSCVEMATGEGKTLTAVLAAACQGWSGRGVHVLTVNDYLASRDAEETGDIYRMLGLTVGVLTDATPPPERRAAYDRDVTYAADKQVIFDWLRDRLVSPLRPSMVESLMGQVQRGSLSAAARRVDAMPEPERSTDWSRRVVQRGLHAAIVDEADSVLIDEAVTPAIIALPAGDADAMGQRDTAAYTEAHRIAGTLERGRDFRFEERSKEVRLTDRGREAIGSSAGALPEFWRGPRRREELITLALRARHAYIRDDDYVVRTNEEGTSEIVIVDRSTGRLLNGRTWQGGVHQAVEAKEGVPITGVRTTTARISYQRFFQLYARLSGLSGTLWEARDEIWRDYGLPTLRLPTHRPVIRQRARDRVFLSRAGKERAVADRVKELADVGRPVLIGARSVESSERIGAMLAERGVACSVLNANREREEAAIVAQAGRRGAVTVATNMAGRGTDIKLVPETRELGGLVVIATERHDERRVDRQLYGRAGRQGDPGRAEVFVSLDDDLIRRMGPPPLNWLTRVAPPGVRAVFARLLWAWSQSTATRRLEARRRETAKTDAWLDMSLHHATR